MYEGFRQRVQAIQQKLPPDRRGMFQQCYLYTLDHAITSDEDSTFVITGDIPAMWLRDSAAQVRPYVPFARDDAELAAMLRGVLQQQADCILLDPYANAFTRSPDDRPFESTDQPPVKPGVWERKYEVDSLCYPLQLCQDYYLATGDETIFDARWRNVIEAILTVWETEQRHDSASTYTFRRPLAPATDTLRHTPTGYTGMTWSGFRPSDDGCEYGYLIPSNMFAVVVLGHVLAWGEQFYEDAPLVQRAAKLRDEIENGIQTFSIFEHPEYGSIYAYEVDGLGNALLMDDANIPSLLSIPYLGYRSANDAIVQNTRRFVLSKDNPYYFGGTQAQGIGSPHTPPQHVWPLALIMQALTCTDDSERESLLRLIVSTTAGTNYMHESFHVDHPATYTRAAFGWANSLFAELLLRHHDLLP